VSSNVMILAASSLVFLALIFLFVGWRSATLTETQKRTREQLRRLSLVGSDAGTATTSATGASRPSGCSTGR